MLGIPSFALSQAYAAASRETPHWETAIQHGPDMIRSVLDEGMPRDVLVNINFPDCAPDDVKGIAVTMQGKRDQELLRIERAMTGAAIPITGSPSAAASTAEPRRHRPVGARRQAHLGHAAAARPHRRAVHDQAGGSVDVGVSRAQRSTR